MCVGVMVCIGRDDSVLGMGDECVLGRVVMLCDSVCWEGFATVYGGGRAGV